MLSSSSLSLPTRVFCGFSVSLLIFLFSAGLSNARAAAGSTTVTSARQGDAIFHSRCAGCHNKQGDDDSPFGPPNLYIAVGHGELSPIAVETIVAHGKGPMPAFGAVLSRNEIRSVIAYLRSEARR
jgi:mono/diheme cytochrome c family protein